MLQYSANEVISSVWPIDTIRLDTEIRLLVRLSILAVSMTYVAQIKPAGPPTSKIVEYKTMRHDQLADIITW